MKAKALGQLDTKFLSFSNGFIVILPSTLL